MMTQGKMPEKRGLGRGLSALMADMRLDRAEIDPQAQDGSETTVPIEKVRPNPEQPRRNFNREEMESLAASIREKGIIQPLIVRVDPEISDCYQIVAGERRWRAAQTARLHQVPVLIRDLSDAEVLEIAIIENIQRSDLNPIEEATGYKQLMDRFDHTQEKLSQVLSRSRSHIANLLRLLQLPHEVQGLLESGDLSAGHARALVTSDDPSALAREVIAKDLTVRETEDLAKSGPKPKNEKLAKTVEKDADTRALEADLSANIGMKVIVRHTRGKEDGQMVISYKTLEDLDELCRLLSAAPPGMRG